MGKNRTAIFAILCLFLISSGAEGQGSDKWHYPLYVANMGYWHSRIPVYFRNSSTNDMYGKPVRLTIGKGKDELHLAIGKEDDLYFEILPTQTKSLSEKGANETWPSDAKWDIRVPVKVLSFGETKSETMPVYVKMQQLYLRLYDKNILNASMQLGKKSDARYFRFENALLFEDQIEPVTEQTVFAYFSGNEKESSSDNKKEFCRWGGIPQKS
jgi:hypothetical protein